MMRKIITIILILLVVMTASGCTITGSKIKTETQAADKAIQASNTMEQLSGTLKEVDKSLG